MPRILIVDDEIGIRSLLAAAFAEAGYDVLTAADGAEAMALCASSGLFDVVLSDVIMPSVNGHDLIRWIMHSHPAIRCVLMTGFDGIDCPGYRSEPACRMLPKPFSLKDAVSLIEQVLREPRLSIKEPRPGSIPTTEYQARQDRLIGLVHDTNLARAEEQISKC